MLFRSALEAFNTAFAAFKAENVQVLATNGNDLTRCVFHEWGDAAASGQVWNCTLSSFTDCLFVHCSTTNQANFSASGETYTGTEAIECVFGSTSNWPATIATIDCHVVTGSAIGTGGTTGSWFDSDPTVDPWSLLPDSGNLDSATGVVPYPSEWRWSGATGDTRGCSKAVGLGAWNVGGIPIEGTVDLASCTWVPLAGAARLAILGQAALQSATWSPLAAAGRAAIIGTTSLVGMTWSPLAAGTLSGIVGSSALAALSWAPVGAAGAVGALGAVDLPSMTWEPVAAGVRQDTLVLVDLSPMSWTTVALGAEIRPRLQPALNPRYSRDMRRQGATARIQDLGRRDQWIERQVRTRPWLPRQGRTRS